MPEFFELEQGSDSQNFLELPSVDDIASSNMPNEVVLHGKLSRVMDGVNYNIYVVLTKNNFRAYHSLDMDSF
jgi:hypothetical protein